MGSVLPSNEAAAPFKVLVIGGAYAGLSAAVNLHDLCQGRAARYGADDATAAPIHAEITLVDERDGFYHLIGSPLVFALDGYANKAWAPYKDMPALQDAAPHIQTIQGSVTALDLAAKKAVVKKVHGQDTVTLAYDFVVVTTGLRRVFPVVAQSLDKQDFVAEVAPHIQTVSSAKDGVLVVGGGAVGIEMAAELNHVQPQTKVTLAHSRARLLSAEPLDDVVGEKTLELLREQSVDVLLEHRLQETRPVADDPTVTEAVFTNGHTLRVNSVIMAISKSVPSTTFLPAEALDKNGLIKITPNLFFPDTVPNADCALAAGDIISWSGIKRCGGAMQQGYFVAVNIHQRMQQERTGKTPEFQKLDEIPPMIGLAVGAHAIAYKNGGTLTWGGDTAQTFFGDDLAFDICWNVLGLSKTSKTGKTDKTE